MSAVADRAASPVVPPWLPGAVRAELDDDPRPQSGRRTLRDVVVDVAVIVLAALVGVVAVLPIGSTHSLNPVVDLSLGAIACVALLWRRRWPIQLAVILNLVSIPLTAVGGPAFLATFSLAVHRPSRYSISVGALQIVCGVVNFEFVSHEEQFWVNSAFLVLITAVVVGWGTSVRNRRQLLISLAERARRAESEQRERLAAVRATERERLAREMHDVLAHRMSLLSVHAGALEYRSDAPPEDVARAAGVIRACVHQMLDDLRDVITMLREDTDDLTAQTHSLESVDALFRDARTAGDDVTDNVRVDGVADLPGVVGRAAYRVVQEGLTNARKHGGSVPVSVDIVGAPGHGVTIQIDQPLNGSIGAGGIPGTGTGLTGLSERVTLAGGTLWHGVVDHRFVLRAELPWGSAALV